MSNGFLDDAYNIVQQWKIISHSVIRFLTAFFFFNCSACLVFLNELLLKFFFFVFSLSSIKIHVKQLKFQGNPLSRGYFNINHYSFNLLFLPLIFHKFLFLFLSFNLDFLFFHIWYSFFVFPLFFL